MDEIINMNKITAIAFILFATAWAETSVTFEVKKSFSWFRIVKTLNYNFVITGRGEGNIVKGVSEWYIWKGYFEQFVGKTKLVRVTNVVNDHAEEPQELVAADQKDDKMILEFGYAVPLACASSKNFDLKVEDNGWNDKIKEIKAVYTCNDAEEPAKEEVKPKVQTEVKIEEPENKDQVNAPVVIEENKPIIQEIVNEDSAKVVVQPVKTVTEEVTNLVQDEQPSNLIQKEEVQPSDIHQEDLGAGNPLMEHLEQAVVQKVDQLKLDDEEHHDDRIVV